MQTILADGFLSTYIPKDTKSVRLHFEFEDEQRRMTPDEFWEFCSKNPKLNAELTKEGDVIIMPPTGFETSDRNSELNLQIRLWAKKDGRGKTADSNGGFILPNGARLGWLIHSKTKQVFIYRPDREIEVLENPNKVSGESLLEGFELDLTEIW